MNTRAKRPGETDGHHAVVLGGSLAGLLAARVLAEHFERVTLIEGDAYLETSEARRVAPPGESRSWTAGARAPNSRRVLSRTARKLYFEYWPMFLTLPGSDESVRRGHRLCIEPKHETEVSVDEDTDRNNS